MSKPEVILTKITGLTWECGCIAAHKHRILRVQSTCPLFLQSNVSFKRFMPLLEAQSGSGFEYDWYFTKRRRRLSTVADAIYCEACGKGIKLSVLRARSITAYTATVEQIEEPLR